jgi:hypothetical protein
VELEIEARHRAQGIPLSQEVIAELVSLGVETSTVFPAPLPS